MRTRRHERASLSCCRRQRRGPRCPPLRQVRTFSVPHYFAPPTYREMPTYEPVVGCGRFSVLAWVAHEEEEDRWRRRRCTFRIRVWPSGVASEGLVGDLRVPVASSPVEYHWHLTKQPAVRPAWCVAPPPALKIRPARPARPAPPRPALPRLAQSACAPEPPALACPRSYEDDPMQAGVSGGPPGKNCWLVDEVSRCWDGGDDDGDGSRGGGPPPPGGRAAPLVVDPAPAPTAGSVLCGA